MAALALGCRNDLAGLAILSTDPDSSVREAAASALVRCPGGTPLLLDMLVNTETSSAVRDGLVSAVAREGGDVISALLQALADHDSVPAMGVLLALDLAPETLARHEVESLAVRPEWRTRVAEAIEQAGDWHDAAHILHFALGLPSRRIDDGVDVILHGCMSNYTDPAVRAAWALARVSSTSPLRPRLIEMLGTEDLNAFWQARLSNTQLRELARREIAELAVAHLQD